VDESLGLVFARIARAVRQTFALEARLAEERRTAEVATAARRVERRKTKVRTAVERVLDAEADESDAENLFYDLTERLETDYDDADFADRPIGELVARICRDLGVTPDWSLWQDEDWAIEARGVERAESEDRQYSAIHRGSVATQASHPPLQENEPPAPNPAGFQVQPPGETAAASP
jgi:hypothetical protein